MCNEMSTNLGNCPYCDVKPGQYHKDDCKVWDLEVDFNKFSIQGYNLNFSLKPKEKMAKK